MNKKLTSSILLGLILSAAGLSSVAGASIEPNGGLDAESTAILNVILTDAERLELSALLGKDKTQLSSVEQARLWTLLEKVSMLQPPVEHYV